MIFIPWSYVLTALGFIGWGGPILSQGENANTAVHQPPVKMDSKVAAVQKVG